MTDAQITTETFGDDALFPYRTVKIGEKTVQTPTKAIPVKDTREHEQVTAESREINEIYRTVDSECLTREQRGASNNIRKKIQHGLNKANSGELSFVFFSYKEANTLEVVDAAFMVDLLETYSDVITVPLLPGLARSIDREKGIKDPAYRSYKKSVLRFLEQVRERTSDTPVMGNLPALGWEFINDLMDVYGSHEVEMFCLNFDRKTVTADRQVAMVKPLMRHMANLGIEEHVLTYAINVYPGRHRDTLDGRPAGDLFSVGMGIDIVGGNHVPPKLPPDVFEEMEASEETPSFRLFDKEAFLYRDVPLDELKSIFPSDSALDAEQVVQRAKASPKNALFRLQRLINAEQMSLATNTLQSELSAGEGYSHFASKPGVTEDVLASCQEIRAGFNDERNQSGLLGY